MDMSGKEVYTLAQVDVKDILDRGGILPTFRSLSVAEANLSSAYCVLCILCFSLAATLSV